MLKASVERLPVWVYGAIAGLLVLATLAAWTRAGALSRAGLLIPAVFWTLAFIIIGLQRRSARS